MSEEFYENSEIEDLIEEYKADPSLAKLDNLAEGLRRARVHMPGRINDQKQVSAFIMNMRDGKKLIPVFSCRGRIGDRIPENTAVAVLPFTEVVRIADNELKLTKLDGIIINLGTSNIIFNPNLIRKIQSAEDEGKEKGGFVALDLENSLPPVENPEFEKLMVAFAQENDEEKRKQALGALLNESRKIQVVVALGVNAAGKNAPFVMSNDKTGEKFLPVYTNAEFAKKRHPDARFGVYPFDKANEMCLSMRSEVIGMMLINETVSVHLKMQLLENVKDVHEKQNAQEAANMAMSSSGAQADKNSSEKKEMLKFSMTTFPRLMFSRGARFIEELDSKKSAYIDELFESSYYDIRKYPYAAEEFSVISIAANDHTDVFEIEFPRRNQGIGTAARAYIIWDKNEDKGRYFGSCRNADDAMLIEEVTPDGVTNHGICAIETNEMSRILEICGV